jgi:hypothetical protein
MELGIMLTLAPRLGMIKLLGAYGTCDCGAPRVLLILRKTIEYSYVTLFHQLDDFHRRQWSFVVDDVLDVLYI